MKTFDSEDNQFMLYGLVPKQSTKGDKSINVVLDVPHTQELLDELNHFLWKDVKLVMEKSSGGTIVQSEFYIANIQPKDYKEGPRIRIILRQPYEQTIFLRIGKLLFNDIKFAMEEIQEELDFDAQAVNE